MSFLFFKGLNFGIDFKGGTLIELRSSDPALKISDLRKSFNNLDLGDVNVKKFGKENDYVVKFEKKQSVEESFIENLKGELKNEGTFEELIDKDKNFHITSNYK